jgi:hypothetical protein
MTVSYQVWQVASLRIDVEQQREIYYKRFYLADSVLDAAIEVASKNFDQIFKLKTPIKFDVAQNIKNSGYAACAQVSATFKKGKAIPDILVVSVFLFKADQSVFATKCLLNRRRSNTKVGYVISNYSIG